MDNLGCFQFFILIYTWIIEDEEEQRQQQQRPVYIEMQPLRPRAQTPVQPFPKPPLIRQRKHVCPESPEFPIQQTSSISVTEPIIELRIEQHTNTEPHTHSEQYTHTEPRILHPVSTDDTFETDFEIIEIADVNKEE